MTERIPILKMGPFLLVTIQVELDDKTAVRLQSELTEKVTETGARGVLLDISGLDVIDSFLARSIATTAAMARALDAETVVVGMQPAVAITLTEMGLTLPGVITALDLEKGMQLLRSRLASKGPGHGVTATRQIIAGQR